VHLKSRVASIRAGHAEHSSRTIKSSFRFAREKLATAPKVGDLTLPGATSFLFSSVMERLAGAAGLPPPTCRCHTFHSTGPATYLANGGTMENARAIAAHELRTTKLYDRTNESPG